MAIKNTELAAAAKEAEKLLKQISESTAIAEKEKAKVAVIVDQVTAKAQVHMNLAVIETCGRPFSCHRTLSDPLAFLHAF